MPWLISNHTECISCDCHRGLPSLSSFEIFHADPFDSNAIRAPTTIYAKLVSLDKRVTAEARLADRSLQSGIYVC